MIGVSHGCCPGGRPIEEFLRECRELEFGGVEHLWHPAQHGGPRPTARFYAATGLGVLALRLAPGTAQGDLCAEFDSGPATSARAAARGLAGAARALGCRQILLEPGRLEFDGAAKLVRRASDGEAGAAAELLARRRAVRDGFLEQLCRNLHWLLREEPELALAIVTPADPLGLPGPEELRLLLEELSTPRLGCWYAPDAGARLARLGLFDAPAWLDAGRGRLAGAYLSDEQDGRLGLAPGSGSVDWRALSGLLRPQDVKLLRVEPGAMREELVVTRLFLRGLGW